MSKALILKHDRPFLSLRQLPVSGTVGHVQYEWDNAKVAENFRKHSVDFVDAIAALEDPNRLEELDPRFAYREERIQASEWLVIASCSSS